MQFTRVCTAILAPSGKRIARYASRSALTLCALLAGFTVEARAQNVTGPASDLFYTPAGGSTFEDFSAAPVPAGFFGPGSDPFSGTVVYQGAPLDATGIFYPTAVDTIVERLTTAILPACPSMQGIPIEIVALNLISVTPITVTFGGGNPTNYEVRACLASPPVVQNIGVMTITQTGTDGGTFSSSLPVTPRLIFTRCSTPTVPSLAQAIADPGPNLLLTTMMAPWTYNQLGLLIQSAPFGGMVDHDCNPATPMVAFPPSSNFFPGVAQVPASTCAGPGGPAHKRLTSEQQMLAAHGILPACYPPGFPNGLGDGTQGPCPCGNIGAPGHGCENSFGTGGGLLYATGTMSVAEDQFGTLDGATEFKAEFLPPSSSGILVQGDRRLAAGVFNGDGLLWIGGNFGPLIRMYTKFANCGKMYFGRPVGDVAISLRGAVPAVGGTYFYQVFYRNAAGFCTPATYNWTNGFRITWVP